jgi:hypothetical protein
MSDIDGTADNTSGTGMNRRALLRAGGMVAGIAGIGGYAAAHASSAGAATGDPVLQGGNNQAGTASTFLNTDAEAPTLLLSNTGPGAPLRLAEHTSAPSISESGDLMNFNGDLQFSHGDSMLASVFTSFNSSRLFPVMPFRAVDTRTAAGRGHIINVGGNLDSAGRLIGGHTIDIDLTDYVYLGTAVFTNLTVTQAVSDGYLTLWPRGTRPATSTLNYSAGQVVANFCVCGLSGVDTLRLYAKATTHVLMDIVAFAAGSQADVNGAFLATAGASNLAGPARKPPAWRTSKNG